MPLKSMIDQGLSVTPKEDLIREDYQPTSGISESYKLNLGEFDLLQAGFESESLGMQGYNKYQEIQEDAMFEFDEDFDDKAKQAYWEEHLQYTIHPKMKDHILSRALSQKHLESIYDYYYNESARLRFLEEQPWWKEMGYASLGEMSNAPLMMAAAMAFPATASVAGSTFVAGAVSTAAASLLIETSKDMMGHQDRTAMDYIGAVAFDGFVGGMFGKFSKKAPLEKTATRNANKVGGITKEVEEKFNKATTTEEKKKILQDAYAKKKVDETIVEQLNTNAKYAEDEPLIKRTWEALRQDMAYITGKSESDTLSKLSKSFFPDGTLQDESMLDVSAIDSIRNTVEESMRSMRQMEFDSKLKQFSTLYRGADGMPVLGKPNASVEDSFSDILGRIQLRRNLHGSSIEDAVKYAMKQVDSNPDTNKEMFNLLVESSQSMSNLANKYHDILNERGHIDFKADGIGKSRIAKDDTYLPLVYDKSSMSRLLNEGLESKHFIQFFKNAMRSKNEGIDEETLNKVATAFYHAIHGSKLERKGTMKDLLKEMFESATTKEEKDIIANMIDAPRPVSAEAGGTSARARTNIDYTYTETFITKDGKELDLSFEDILSKDYMGNMDTYARKMAGTTAMQKFKYTDTVPLKTREQAEIDVKGTPDYKRTARAIEERDSAIKELYERADEIKRLEEDTYYDGVYNLAKDMGVRSEDLAEIADEIASLLGKNADELNLKEIGNEIRLRAEIDNLKMRAEATDLEQRLDDIMKQGLKDAGYHRPFREVAYDLGKALRREAQDLANGIKVDADLKQSNQIIEELLKDYPREIVEEIVSATNKINAKYKNAAKLAHTNAEKIFAKEIKEKKFDRKYDEIFKDEMAKIKVNKAKEEKMLDEAFKKATFREEEKGLYSMSDYADLRNRIVKELEDKVAEGKITEKVAEKDLVRFDTIIKDFTGVSTSANPSSNWNRAYKIGHTYNIGRLLGQTFWTMSAEGTTVLWDVGVKNFIRSMPALSDLIRGYRTGKMKSAQLNEINESLGLYNEFMSGAKQFEFDHELSATYTRGNINKNWVDKTINNVESFGQSFAEFTLMMGGVKPLTAMFQTAHVQGVFNKMIKVANGGRQNTAYKKMVRELGFSEDMAERIYENMRRHATEDGLMNFKKWDTEIKNLFLDGVKTRTDTLVQMQRLGDKLGWVAGDNMIKDTVMGKLAMELKQFVFTAYVKQLGRAVNRADMHIMGLVASQIAILTLSYSAKQHANFIGNEEKLEKAMQPDRIVAGTMGMMPQGSLLPMIMGLTTKAFIGENIFGNRHSGGATDMLESLPMLDLLNRLIELVSTPFELTDGMQVEDFTPAGKLLGVTNNMITRPVWEAAIDDEKKDDKRSGRF